MTDNAALPEPTVDALFAGKDPIVAAIYARIVSALHQIGDFRADPKKSSIHLVRATGFAGVHPRKSSLVLNLRLGRPIETPRLLKSEQVSRGRYHNELKLSAPDDVDDDVVAWLREAHNLG